MRNIKHVTKKVESHPNYIGQPLHLLFYVVLGVAFLLFVGWLVIQILSGPNPLEALIPDTTPTPKPVVSLPTPQIPVERPIGGQPDEALGECPHPLTAHKFIVCADVLSILNKVPVSNDPAEFGDAQVGSFVKGDQIVILGRFDTVLANGIEARFLVVSFEGHKALVFHQKLDTTFTTNVDDGYYSGLAEIDFP